MMKQLINYKWNKISFLVRPCYDGNSSPCITKRDPFLLSPFHNGNNENSHAKNEIEYRTAQQRIRQELSFPKK